MLEIKIKPFLSVREKGIKGTASKLQMFDDRLETSDYYEYETLIDDDNPELGFKSMKVDAISVVEKKSISSIDMYYDNHQDGYFISIKGDTWGFADREDALLVFNRIKAWLYGNKID